MTRFRHGRTDYLARIGGERFAEPKEGDAVEVKFPASPHWHTGKARLQWRAGSFTEAGIDLAGSLTCAGLGLTRPVFCAGYAAAYLYSPKRRDCLLALGSDDGCRAWLNHREIGNAVEKLRGAAPDQELFPVTLQPGCNLLLLKIDQHTGGWGFYCRFLDRRPPTGHRFAGCILNPRETCLAVIPAAWPAEFTADRIPRRLPAARADWSGPLPAIRRCRSAGSSEIMAVAVTVSGAAAAASLRCSDPIRSSVKRASTANSVILVQCSRSIFILCSPRLSAGPRAFSRPRASAADVH